MRGRASGRVRKTDDSEAAQALAPDAEAEVRAHVARACSSLPAGPPAEQLRNFCGRVWEILHTPTYAALDRLWSGEIGRRPDPARLHVDGLYGTVLQTLVGIIERGIVEGQFRAVAPSTAARVIMAALSKQAFWCNHVEAFGPAVGGGCNRVVADTLSILLGGLQPSRPDSTS